MKNSLALAMITSFGLLLPSLETHAGDRDWAAAGKILTGIMAADVLFNRLPAWQQQQRQNSVRTYRIVRDPPPPPFYSFPRQYDNYNDALPPQPAVVPATPREEIPPQIVAGGTTAAENEEPAVIHVLSPVKRIYQPRIQGHKAYVQERVSPKHPWVTVEEYPSIW